MTRLHNGNPCQNILSAAKNVWERKVLANVDLKWPSSTGRYFQGKGNRKRLKKNSNDEVLLCARHGSKVFTWTSLHLSRTKSVNSYANNLHFADEDSDAQRHRDVK